MAIGKVFPVQMPKRWDETTGRSYDAIDISPATEHGEIQPPLFPGKLSFYTHTDVIEVGKLLKDFGPDDSILAIGDPAAIAMSAILAAEANQGSISVLRWERKRGGYVRITFDTRGKKVEDND